MAGLLADSRDYAGFDREWANGNGVRRMIRRRMKRVESRNTRQAINNDIRNEDED